jgi:GAF domain-containing protein
MLGKMKIQLDRLRSQRKELFLTEETGRRNRLVPFYVRIVAKAVSAERCSVFILNPQNNTVWLKAGTGVKEHEIEVPKTDSLTGRVIETGELVMESGLEKKPGSHHKEIEARTGFVPRSIMCVPIKSPFRQEVTGAFEVLNKIGASEFSEDDLAIAKEVAEHLRFEVDAIFLDQDIFRLTERFYSVARNATIALLATGTAVALVVAIASLIYVAMPTIAR